MTTEIDDFDALSGDAVLQALSWMQKRGIWEGRPVTWEEAPYFQKELEQRILTYLFSSDPSSAQFLETASMLAWIGTAPEERPLLEKEIVALKLTEEGALVLQAGFGKKVSKFWKKHKTEIIIAAAALAIIGVAVVVSCTTAGSAAAPIAVAGGALLDQLNNQDQPRSSSCGSTIDQSSNEGERDRPEHSSYTPTRAETPFSFPIKESPSLELCPTTTFSPSLPDLSPPPLRTREPLIEMAISRPTPQPPLSMERGRLYFKEEGIFCNGERLSRAELMQRARIEAQFSHMHPLERMPNGFPSQKQVEPLSENPSPSTNPVPELQTAPSSNPLTIIGWEMIDPELRDPNYIDVPIPERSRYMHTDGIQVPHMAIGGINGMNTTAQEAANHMEYLHSFAPDYRIDWVYNQTHGVGWDILEAWQFNHRGSSPNTEGLLIENWTNFHEQNKDNPRAKYLQFGHSQGTIHIKNALDRVPEEVADHVIVVGLGSAKVIPDRTCYSSDNFAGEKDIIHYGEIAVGILDVMVNPFLIGKLIQTIEDHKELILLDPHPDDHELLGHSFQNPTFREEIKRILEDYIEREGEYE